MEGHPPPQGRQRLPPVAQRPVRPAPSRRSMGGPAGAADVDVAALLLGADGRVRSDEDFVFYNAPTGGDGAVRLLGKRRTTKPARTGWPSTWRRCRRTSSGSSSWPAWTPLRAWGSARCPIWDSSCSTRRGARVRFDVDDVGPETAIVLGELYLPGRGLEVPSGRSGLGHRPRGPGHRLRHRRRIRAGGGPAFGGRRTRHEVPAVVAPPAEEPAADLVEVPVDEIGVDELAPGRAGWRPKAATESAPQQRGVRTRKKRTLVTSVAPPALAVGPSWQPARLFSITGVGTAREQEQRATSTLLSTMMAVREFGRALVARFGGPAGVIEAYLEVPFTLDDRTPSPGRGDPGRPRRSDLDGALGGQDRHQPSAQRAGRALPGSRPPAGLRRSDHPVQ